jgi:predicted DNA-binding protein with PD1-like motif
VVHALVRHFFLLPLLRALQRVRIGRRAGKDGSAYFWAQYSMHYLVFLATLLLATFNPSTTMQHRDSTTIHAFRLKPGQDLRKEIEAYVRKANIKAGWMVTCVGSLTEANLRLANQPEGTAYKGHFEIVSLVGTLSTAGCHLHLSFSDSTGKTMGGHLLPGNRVYTTAEIVIGESKDMVFTREKDGSTPWEELQIKKL